MFSFAPHIFAFLSFVIVSFGWQVVLRYLMFIAKLTLTSFFFASAKVGLRIGARFINFHPVAFCCTRVFTVTLFLLRFALVLVPMPRLCRVRTLLTRYSFFCLSLKCLPFTNSYFFWPVCSCCSLNFKLSTPLQDMSGSSLKYQKFKYTHTWSTPLYRSCHGKCPLFTR